MMADTKGERFGIASKYLARAARIGNLRSGSARTTSTPSYRLVIGGTSPHTDKSAGFELAVNRR